MQEKICSIVKDEIECSVCRKCGIILRSEDIQSYRISYDILYQNNVTKKGEMRRRYQILFISIFGEKNDFLSSV